ncbi:hypothetical protein HKD37_14G039756 [Glycine soja]
MCNKITKIREERNANLFHLGSATPRAYIQSQATQLRFFTNFVNTLQLLNIHWDPSPLCSRFSQVKKRTVF